jgi:3-deoxy-7-phosphoheptulonate synthase
MIVVMKPGCTPADVQHVVDLVRQLGLRDHVIVGTDRTVIAAIGDKRTVDKGAIENAPMVDRVVPILAPYKVASKEVKREASVIRIGPSGAEIGGRKIGVIAGPCSVESEEQILATARAVRAAGAIGLRGGAFKPRTNPYAFQGLGESGLKLLAAAREQTGLAVVTEVMSVDQVDLVSGYADVLQIGARNMQNFLLLAEVGRLDKPVLIKRGLSATIEEWLMAAEYVVKGGNRDVILCERGIRTFETATRNTLDLGAVAVAKLASHLPVVVDPSHATGRPDLVLPLSLAGVAVGADGLIVETHPNPEHALCDGPQSIPTAAFGEYVARVFDLARWAGRSVA